MSSGRQAHTDALDRLLNDLARREGGTRLREKISSLCGGPDPDRCHGCDPMMRSCYRGAMSGGEGVQ